MAASLEVVLVRHGETEWSKSGQHTSRTDLPLTATGEHQARQLGIELAGRPFAVVLTSPLRRAWQTAELAGFGAAERVDDLRELDYGEYEGCTTAEIRQDVSGWTVWSGVLPGGETLADAAARAERVIERLRARQEPALLFGHGHMLRILAAHWSELPPRAGAYFALDPASISVLGYERTTPVIRSWNLVLDWLDPPAEQR